MSPDIEWRVGEDDEQETVVKTVPPHRSRRSWLVIAIVVLLGTGLGVIYRSLPEPPAIVPTPVPAVITSPLSPLPTPAVPEPLTAAVERDVLRLASSAGEANHMITFGTAGDTFADWYSTLQNAYGRWGTPLDQDMYTVSATGTLPSGVAWVTLGQFRHGDIYRQTRFYQLEHNRWVWTLPDRSFWSGKTTVTTTNDISPIGPIIIQSPIEDVSASGPVLDRFSQVYQTLCVSLHCVPPIVRAYLWTPGFTLSVSIKPMLLQPVVQGISTTLFIDLPSPNVVGTFDKANALGDPYVAMAYDTLIYPAVQVASGDYTRWESNRNGILFLQAIATWQRARLPSDLYLLTTFFHSAILPPSVDMAPSGKLVERRGFYVNPLREVQLIPLAGLWTWPTDGSTSVTDEQTAAQEAQALIVFIEEKYGKDGVVRFLNALGTADSLKTAVETALPIKYSEFDQLWNKWIRGE